MKIIIIILINLICNTLTFSQTKEQAELPNLTGKIKVDKQGREYIIDPNTPNKRIYLESGPSNLDIYRKAAQENQTPQSWLQGSPISYQDKSGSANQMSYETLIDPQKREKFLAKEQAKHLQSQIHVGLIFIIAIIFIILFSIFLIKYLKK